MKFNPGKVGFGRHETFPLRYSWLTKGIKALEDNPVIFKQPEATVVLGVGKNMVNAIRFWLLAARLIETTEKGYEKTQLGASVFGHDGFDRYIEDEATIWLIHWLISSNPEQATAWFWFFNYFHKPEFETTEVAEALRNFVGQKVTGRCAPTTIDKDAAMLLRMYARARGNSRTPLEDMLDSPMVQLKLITQASTGRGYTSAPAERNSLPSGIFGYAVNNLFDDLGVSELPIEELMYSKGGYAGPGAVFRLTENALLTKLEKLIHKLPGYFELRETAGIHQLYRLNEIDSMDFLEFHYLGKARGLAA